MTWVELAGGVELVGVGLKRGMGNEEMGNGNEEMEMWK